MTGRLPSLKDSKPKVSLKFKPKAVSRRSKQEREASAPKLKMEDDTKIPDKKKPRAGKPQQRRLPRYLQNTHVITSGPLAAGNFAAGRDDSRRSYFKSSEGDSDLMQKSLMNIRSTSDDEDDDDGLGSGNARFNMGREIGLNEWNDLEKEIYNIENEPEEEHIDPNDEEALQARRVEELFPIRPLRVRHEDTEGHPVTKAEDQEDTPIKDEDVDTKLEDVEEITELLPVPETEPVAINDHEAKIEEEKKIMDNERIAKRLDRINNQPSKFVLFQLPSTLPEFKDDYTPPPTEETKKDEKTAAKPKPASARTLKKKQEVKKSEVIEQSELNGRIGALRVHRSGKVTVRIGDVIMDVTNGANTTFFQDVISLNASEENPSAIYLGQVEDKFVVTPQF